MHACTRCDICMRVYEHEHVPANAFSVAYQNHVVRSERLIAHAPTHMYIYTQMNKYMHVCVIIHLFMYGHTYHINDMSYTHAHTNKLIHTHTEIHTRYFYIHTSTYTSAPPYT